MSKSLWKKHHQRQRYNSIIRQYRRKQRLGLLNIHTNKNDRYAKKLNGNKTARLFKNAGQYIRYFIPHMPDMSTQRDKPTQVVHVLYDEYDVYIGRANNHYDLEESPWHNPFCVGKDGTREEVIQKYRLYLLFRHDLLCRLPELYGKRLACWCKSPDHRETPCHGDVLVEFINAMIRQENSSSTEDLLTEVSGSGNWLGVPV